MTPDHRPGRITKLLIANRGEIACRIIRTAREMGIRTVAIYVSDDADSPHTKSADEAIRLESGSYLDAAGIVEVATVSQADAVHPGYGFLSENADFAQQVIDAGLTWIGPPPAAIAAMGDKLAAKRLAVEVGVATLPMVESTALADTIGYPLLVKASAGGGGRGMRVVESAGDLEEAVAGARREALAGFGDDTVFIERYVPRSRHVEIQVLADTHGAIVHLGERECSIQRRHQKVVEESPSPVVDSRMREEMGASAIRLMQALGYASAGTVEFLVEDEPGPDGRRPFWFLEVNTRLQVEHPVTELVTGIDLVRQQILVAEGEALAIRQDDVRFTGHAVEVRLYAEDAAAGFLPATGRLVAFEPAAAPAVRWDGGVETGSVIGTKFDPMLAKVIGYAPSRSEAASRLALALERTHIAGVTTNRDVLVSILRDPGYARGETTTDFFDRFAPARVRQVPDADLWRIVVCAGLWMQGLHRSQRGSLAHLPSGFRVGRLPNDRFTVRHGDDEVCVRYVAQRDGGFLVNRNLSARIKAWTADGIDAEIDRHRLHLRITQIGDRLVVNDGAGDLDLEVLPTFADREQRIEAGGLSAPMPGQVTEVRVTVGETVQAGQSLAVLEAMKMEHHIRSPRGGVIAAVAVRVGDQVSMGDTLFVLEDS